MNKLLASGIHMISVASLCAGLGIAQPPSAEIASERPDTTHTPAIPSRREQAFIRLFEGQRHMWKLQRMQTQAGRENARILARQAFEAVLTFDPTIVEANIALAQLAVAVPPRDIDEGIRHAELAVKANAQNVGGFRMLARFFTVKSRLNNGSLEPSFADRAQGYWREVARLEPRNAEAWAFLSSFAEAQGRSDEQIEALQKWMTSAAPSDVGFFEGTMGGSSLAPEFAGLKLATALMAAGKHGEAAAVLTRLVSDDPENAEAASLLAETADASEGTSAEAVITAIRHAIQSDPENADLVNTLARLYDRVGRYDEAVALLKRHISSIGKSDPRTASSLALSLSDLHLNRDRLDDSSAAVENALAIRGIRGPGPVKREDREFVKLAHEKLIHLAKLSDRPQSVKDRIDRARDLLGPTDIFADKQLIVLLQRQGAREEALALVRRVRASHADDIQLLRSEASVLTDLGKVDEAVGLIKTHREAKTSTNRGGASIESGTISVSIPATDEFSDLLFVSDLYSRAGRKNEAIRAAHDALAAAAGRERKQIARLALATTYQHTGDHASAESTLVDILKEMPDNPIALNNLGYLLAEKGERLDEAVLMVKKALKIDPKNPSFLGSLGRIYFRLGDLTEAERFLSRAARVNPDSSIVLEHLGDLHDARSDVAKARLLWEKALRMARYAAETSRLQKKLAR